MTLDASGTPSDLATASTALRTPAIPPVPAVRPTAAIRPIEASKAAVRNVRFTSTPAVRSAQIAAIPK
jgi:hypothetical protein